MKKCQNVLFASNMLGFRKLQLCCSVLQCVEVFWGALRCFGLCYSVLQCDALYNYVGFQQVVSESCSCVAACCSVLRCFGVCHGVLRCVVVCCSVMQCVQIRRLSASRVCRIVWEEESFQLQQLCGE